ncbi:MAG: YceI family protein [Winogradskyella sp.]|nr:YceI family protein [Winogradskyella sp.]MBT8375909.1 YceI family protein [Bacteroidia bacterium]NNC45430.1 YceI family protein [Winogradskyella sp.]NNF86335.1 YceI family protein [Winogradskyella sp.]NNK40808.1 YceI family protein [Winogradskyella sp.]
MKTKPAQEIFSLVILYNLKKLLSILLFAVLTSFVKVSELVPLNKEYRTQIFFSSNSSLRINCKTNINKFYCDFDINKVSDSLEISYSTNGSKLDFSKASLILPNLFFNCGGRQINKDFHALLKTEEFPEIQLTLINLSFLEKDACNAIVTVDIEICDIIKTYKIPVTINTDNSINVAGKLPIDILDFSLEPPTKVLGMIKVSNEIEIEFHLNINIC